VLGKATDVVDPDTVITYGIVLPGPNQNEAFPTLGDRTSRLSRSRDQLCERHRRNRSLSSASELREGDVLLCIIRHLKVSTRSSWH